MPDPEAAKNEALRELGDADREYRAAFRALTSAGGVDTSSFDAILTATRRLVDAALQLRDRSVSAPTRSVPQMTQLDGPQSTGPQLTGKVAMVTGGASGIGRATATRLAGLGARVCVVDLSSEGKAVADELDGMFVQGDVGDPAFNTAMVQRCEDELGGLDLAHFNAGVTCTEGADITALTDEQYHRTLRVNVNGVVFGIRAAVPVMERRGGGAIVVTASLAGLIGFSVDPIYTLTKHAVVGLVRSLPEHLTPKGIRINCVNPGIVATPLVGDEAIQMFADAGFPLLQPEDIANAVVKILDGTGTGECWPVQPGRDPEPYQFRQVPGPRTTGAEGMRPPSVEAS